MYIRDLIKNPLFLYALCYTFPYSHILKRKKTMKQTTYTIWFQDGGGRQEFLTEEEMRKQSKIFSFDPEQVIQFGETFMWADGIEPYDNPRSASDDVVGGCYRANK